jgi:hypothetical protein
VNEEGTAPGSTTGSTLAARKIGGAGERRRYCLLADTQLVTFFNHVVDQPTPDEFLDLLRRIDARCSPA